MPFESFLILVCGIPLLTLCSAWYVAKFVWLPMKEKYEKEKLEPLVIPYCYRYPFTHEQPITDNSGVVLTSAAVLENTDHGYVVMRYNDALDAFEYWADDTPQYRSLEAVARKFVQGFRCEHLYIHRRRELRKKLDRLREEAEKEETKAPLNNSVFATFKTTAKRSNRSARACCDQANKYIKRGRLSECTYFKQEEVKVEEEENALSFSDWKKIVFC